VPTWCFHPYWKPRSQGTCSPFTIPARLCICIYIPKRQFVCTHTQTQKIPRVFLRKEEKFSGDGGSRIRLIWRYSYIADCRKSKNKLPLIVYSGSLSFSFLVSQYMCMTLPKSTSQSCYHSLQRISLSVVPVALEPLWSETQINEADRNH
jgi:hypothetical protein